jgi:hypothetical protein
VLPVPDRLVSSLAGDPAEITVSRESIRLAFIAALQHLVPRQRAVLILRDVLSWRASEVAELLETSDDAVNSTLRRTRSALAAVSLDAVPAELTEADRQLLHRYIEAFKRYDGESLVALLHDDATLSMPPFEMWLRGVPDIRSFLAAIDVEGGRDQVIEVAANGCPALAVYRPAASGALEAFEIHVLEIADGRIAASTPSSTRPCSPCSGSLRHPNRSARRPIADGATGPKSPRTIRDLPRWIHDLRRVAKPEAENARPARFGRQTEWHPPVGPPASCGRRFLETRRLHCPGAVSLSGSRE